MIARVIGFAGLSTTDGKNASAACFSSRGRCWQAAFVASQVLSLDQHREALAEAQLGDGAVFPRRPRQSVVRRPTPLSDLWQEPLYPDYAPFAMLEEIAETARKLREDYAGRYYMWITSVSRNSRGYGTNSTAPASPWASRICDLIANEFPCAPETFSGLIFCSALGDYGEGLEYWPPGRGKWPQLGFPGHIVAIKDLETWKTETGGGLPDWECKICHELIHYLHEKWGVNTLVELSEVEDLVSGTGPYLNRRHVESKADVFKAIQAGVEASQLELDPHDLTENHFRIKRGLRPMREYGEAVWRAK